MEQAGNIRRRARRAAVAMILLLTATVYAEPLSPIDTGRIPPPVPGTYQGIGDAGHAEVLTARGLRQFASDAMSCYRAKGPAAADACLAREWADYRRWVSAPAFDAAPACLDPLAVGADFAAMLADLQERVYCAGYRPGNICERRLNNALEGLVFALIRWKLETAIGELPAGQRSLARQEAELDQYTAGVMRLPGCPPCLDGPARVAIGSDMFDWLGAHSGDIFCLGEE